MALVRMSHDRYIRAFMLVCVAFAILVLFYVALVTQINFQLRLVDPELPKNAVRDQNTNAAQIESNLQPPEAATEKSNYFPTYQQLLTPRKQTSASAPLFDGANSENLPVVLWWTKSKHATTGPRTCGINRCYFTSESSFFVNANPKVIAFVGSSLNVSYLPLPRRHNDLWALLHTESPITNPVLNYNMITMFNYTATFSRYSDFPLAWKDLDDISQLLSGDYFVKTTEKTWLQKVYGIAPVLFITPSCSGHDTPSHMRKYVKELMNYIQVDSYGRCLQNKMLPSHLRKQEFNYSNSDMKQLMAAYKFTIAFEDSACLDYTTSKLISPLLLGSVPIYFGDLTVEDWLPNKPSAILVTNYPDPKRLADFIKELNMDDEYYEDFIQHKVLKRVSNNLLKNTVNSRTWSSPKEYVNGYECYLCQKLFDFARKSRENSEVTAKYANNDHYYCPLPIDPLTHRLSLESHWSTIFYQAKYMSEILTDNIIHNGNNIKPKLLNELTLLKIKEELKGIMSSLNVTSTA